MLVKKRHLLLSYSGIITHSDGILFLLYSYTSHHENPSNRILPNFSNLSHIIQRIRISIHQTQINTNQYYDSRLCRLGLALAPLVPTVPLLWLSCGAADGALGASALAWPA
jgi:hypothetical protein